MLNIRERYTDKTIINGISCKSILIHVCIKYCGSRGDLRLEHTTDLASSEASAESQITEVWPNDVRFSARSSQNQPMWKQQSEVQPKRTGAPERSWAYVVRRITRFLRSRAGNYLHINSNIYYNNCPCEISNLYWNIKMDWAVTWIRTVKINDKKL